MGERSDRSGHYKEDTAVDTARTRKTYAQAAPSPEGFDLFWKTYPRKRAKPKALHAWKKLRPSEVPAVMAGLERWKHSEDWGRDGGRFIPYPATFVNQRRWEDDLGQQEQARSPRPEPKRADQLSEAGKKLYEQHGVAIQ